jgi:hypothetical protein
MMSWREQLWDTLGVIKEFSVKRKQGTENRVLDWWIPHFPCVGSYSYVVPPEQSILSILILSFQLPSRITTGALCLLSAVIFIFFRFVNNYTTKVTKLC